MRSYHLSWSSHAEADLATFQLSVVDRITSKMKFYSEQVSPLSFAKPLRDKKFGDYRFRVGDYRAYVEVDDKGNITVLLVLAVEHRGKSYRRAHR